MILTVLIALFSLIILIVIHEFGHFILAKKFGTKVEEFGVGYPPRLFGRQFGETFYSINLLPFGAFVKIRGEQGGVEDYRSFIGLPMWQRISIVLGGVVSFWIVSAILLSVVAGVWGLPVAVNDDDNSNLIEPKVQVALVMPDSPARAADLKTGDVILGFDKVRDLQDFIKEQPAQEVTLMVKRGQDVYEKNIALRTSYPVDEGPLGIGLTRVALKPYPWYQAPVQGVLACGQLTANIVQGWVMGVKSMVGLEELPKGVEMELRGPLGILDLLREYFNLGINYFLFLVSLISVALALVNILPIPALDGGKIVFLCVEWLRGRPINYKIEQKISATFFILMILLLIFVTIKFDIPRLF